jgi:hypothetical protein
LPWEEKGERGNVGTHQEVRHKGINFVIKWEWAGNGTREESRETAVQTEIDKIELSKAFCIAFIAKI